MIAVIGYSGVVGSAVAKAFSHLGVIGVDHKSPDSIYGDVAKCDFVFVCVPTPMSENGTVNMSICDSVVEKLKNNRQSVVIKSTVLPLTNERYSELYPNLTFISSPEFLTEANPVNDFINQDRVIIGTYNLVEAQKLKNIYESSIKAKKYIFMTPLESEMVKYFSNYFLAMKVIYFNEVNYICQKLGADFDMVRRGVTADSRIGESHSFMTTMGGFGGMCFPKDTNGIANFLKDKNIDVDLLKIVPELNKKWRHSQ